MYSILLFLAMLCHNPNHHSHAHNCQSSGVTTLDDGLDDNGDSGHVPPKPPTNPPPGNP